MLLLFLHEIIRCDYFLLSIVLVVNYVSNYNVINNSLGMSYFSAGRHVGSI